MNAPGPMHRPIPLSPHASNSAQVRAALFVVQSLPGGQATPGEMRRTQGSGQVWPKPARTKRAKKRMDNRAERLMPQHYRADEAGAAEKEVGSPAAGGHPQLSRTVTRSRRPRRPGGRAAARWPESAGWKCRADCRPRSISVFVVSLIRSPPCWWNRPPLVAVSLSKKNTKNCHWCQPLILAESPLGGAGGSAHRTGGTGTGRSSNVHRHASCW